jgi:hypothetical protein
MENLSFSKDSEKALEMLKRVFTVAEIVAKKSPPIGITQNKIPASEKQEKKKPV